MNTSQHSAALRYPIRLQVVFKYFGKLNMVLAVLVLVPLGVSISFADYGISLRYGVIAAGLLAMGLGLSRLPGTKRIQTNEAMSLTALAFLFAPLLMAYPMMGSGLPFLDALFEAISAVTTTGLTTTATVSGKPQTFLFARAWMQWYGGLGIVVLALAIMIEPGVAARRLGNMGEYDDDLIGATRSHVRYILLVYGLLTAMGICLLLALKSNGWNAVLYAFATVSTGGFAPQDGSLSALQSFPQQAAVIFLSMAGAIFFIFYRRQIREDWRLMFHDRQTQFFLLAAVFSALLLVLLLHFQNEFSWPMALRHGILNAFSAQSTSGFSSMDFSRLDGGSKLVMILSMLSGGCVGSTAGGIKILRLMVMARLIYLMILKAGLSKNASKGIKLTGKKLENKEVNPKNCDFLFCMTNSDETNIITSLLGRSLGFKRVVTSIENTELEDMCREIDLQDVIIPAQSISQHIEEMVEGLDDIELSTLLKGDARFFSFIADKEEATEVSKLDLPKGTKCMYFYRDEQFSLVDEKTRFKKGDEIVLVTHVNNLRELNERWDAAQIMGQ